MVEDAEIIATYERLESCRKVADALGIKSQEYVRRVLVKNGIKRTHRHDHEHQRLCNCNGKASLCAALVVMLRTVGNLRCCEITDITGYNSSSVGQIIARRGLVDKRRRRDIDETILDVIEAEYLSGASTYELGGKYGVCHQTISKWMKQRGHSRGNDFSNKSDEFKQWVAEIHGSSFTVINYENRRHVTIQCNICGHTFTRQARKSTSIRCPICYEHYMLENHPKHRHHGSGNSLKRARKYGATIERGITLKKVFDRDDRICQICGCICDWSDITPSSIGPKYPTIDHVIALVNGGSHTWDNVQLAHHICNSKKRDFLEVSA